MSAAKFWVGLLGAIVTSLLTVFTADSTIGKVLSVAAALLTAISVYLVPNTPTPPAGVTGTYVGGK